MLCYFHLHSMHLFSVPAYPHSPASNCDKAEEKCIHTCLRSGFICGKQHLSTWVVLLLFPFVPVTPQSELEFWSALCLPTNSKEPLYSPSSVDGSGLFHPIRQFERKKKKKERKAVLGWFTHKKPPSGNTQSLKAQEYFFEPTGVKRFACFTSAKICAFCSA